jgi:hypothetical protein
MNSIQKWFGLIVVCVAACAVAVPAARADFDVEAFDGQVRADSAGTAFTQAGGHPYDASTSIAFSTAGPDPFGGQKPDGNPKDIQVDLPPGFLGNPRVAAECSEGQLEANECPLNSQVGFVVVRPALIFGVATGVGIYNVEPGRGELAALGMNFAGNSIVHLIPTVRSDGDFGLRVSSADTAQTVPLNRLDVTLWGTPASPAHDSQRTVSPCSDFSGAGITCFSGTGPSTLPEKPFLTNPADCWAGPLTTTIRANSWQSPGNYVTASFQSHLPPAYPAPKETWGPPQGVTGCDRLLFDPSLSAQPTTISPDSPSGLELKLSFPQDGLEDKEGTAAAPLKDATITLPEGMTINPAAASGLEACADAQLNRSSTAPASCPPASKIGTATAVSPLLEESVSGSLYIGSQLSTDPASGQMFRLFLNLVNENRGLDVKLPGQVRVNPETGRVEASLANNPQLPVAEIAVSLKTGPRAPLATPTGCGTKATAAHLTSWSGQQATLTAPYTIPCPVNRGFSPSFAAGTHNPVAAATSPFAMQLSRTDGQQELASIEAKLPKGLTAYLKGTPYCPEGAIVAAANRGGRDELANPSCPASRIGTIDVGAGAGTPFHVKGTAYLAGPYRGAPLSLAVITPAVAGPFDLGTVVVRAALRVDPASAEITAVSDPLPQIVKGVPLRLRSVDFDVDKPKFTLNPTSCDPMQVAATIGSSQGTKASVASRFQVADCANLAFKPSLKLKVSGGTKRGSYTKLRAELKAAPGQANIGKASVALPHSIFLAQEHIRTICTRVQYAAKACPEASVYGYARAFTPLLDQPLEGPVYLRSSNNPLPDLVASLDGQIHIDLAGRVDSVNGGIRTTFEGVPDAPVSKFVLSMKGGKKSLLVNSANLCKNVNRATVKLDGQNGKVNDFRPVVGNDCGKKGRKGGGKKRK